MGTGARPRPERLAVKLRQIRDALGLSQSEMVRRLGVEGMITYNKISHYELGKREPPLTVLLEYAHLANVLVEVLIDDTLDLPQELPSRKRHEGLKRRTSVQRRASK